MEKSFQLASLQFSGLYALLPRKTAASPKMYMELLNLATKILTTRWETSAKSAPKHATIFTYRNWTHLMTKHKAWNASHQLSQEDQGQEHGILEEKSKGTHHWCYRTRLLFLGDVIWLIDFKKTFLTSALTSTCKSHYFFKSMSECYKRNTYK